MKTVAPIVFASSDPVRVSATRIVRSLKASAWAVLLAPASAFAGFSKPLRDVPEQIGTGAFAIDHQWSLAGLIGLVVVVALLAGFYRRDK